MKTKMIVWLVVLGSALLAACGTGPAGERVSVLSEAEAAEIVDNAMQAFRTGDYTGWTRDWSPAMKAAISESDFLAYREQVTAQYGELRSVGAVELTPGAKTGFVRWSAIAVFENGRIRFSFSFADDGRVIEGVFPEAVD